MKIALTVICMVAVFSSIGATTPVLWSIASGGNGHWYEAVHVSSPGITWLESRVAAESAGGYLATTTSETENNFVFSLVNDRPEFWWQYGPWVSGPWLGGYQDRDDPSYSEPLGGWKWVSGESWSYTNWMQGEPSGTEQDYLHFCGYNLIAPTWDDAGASYVIDPNQQYRGYIVEYEPVPEPSSLLALGGGMPALAGGIRRRR